MLRLELATDVVLAWHVRCFEKSVSNFEAQFERVYSTPMKGGFASEYEETIIREISCKFATDSVRDLAKDVRLPPRTSY